MGRKKLELTWLKPTKRWRKRYKGKDYYFPYGESKSDRQGYEKALAEWRETKARLDADKPHRQEYERVILRLARMRDWFQKRGDQEGYDQVRARCEELQARLDGSDSPAPLARWERDPMWALPEQAKAIWEDRLAGEDAGAAAPPDETIASNIDSFLKRKESQVNGDERSPGRYESLRCCLERFQKWIGGHRDVHEITAKKLIDYHSFLLDQIKAKKMSRYYARDHMQAVRQFVRWCWELDLLDLPRNIGSPDLTVKVSDGRIETFAVEEIQQLLNSSSETTKLYLLLMLNCGMQQQDIAQLRQDEVDWERGRIIRRRSKTRGHANVPEVNYKLWADTFALLKECRSADSSVVLLNKKGGSLKTERIVAGRLKKVDDIRSAYARVVRKLKIKQPKPLKLIRKTAASKLEEHRDYGKYGQHYLGQAPSTIADKHYVIPSQKAFDDAIEWLGKQYGLT